MGDIYPKYDIFYPHNDGKYINCKFSKTYLQNEQLTKIQLPNLENFRTLYTKCDYAIERSVHESILRLEELFKEYQKFFEQELKTQKELVNSLWLYSQRYLIIARSGVCVKPYPEIISLNAEKIELCKFYTSLKAIKRSICLLHQSMEKMKTSFSQLIELYKQLDMTVDSPFINGSLYFYSVSDIKNILNDLLYYFNSNLCKMICLAKFLDPGDAESIENYSNFISTL